SYGLVLRALVDSLYDGDVARISQYGVSFAGILFPGETLRVRAWRSENGVVATADSVERDNAPVLGNIVLAQDK
ncbi:MAG TPA: 3-alpha,7-alpha,12-alpha-trihydroxy-5-beta-cholest-24-enoyl-CoA hydratase, partial [Dietzia timorensis]